MCPDRPGPEGGERLERVGRALADEFGLPFDPSPFADTLYDRDYWMNLARAALAALPQEPVSLTPEEAEKVYAGLEYAGWTFRSDAPSHIILSKLRALAEEEE